MPPFLTPIITWIGRSMLVRFAVGSAAAGVGAMAASAASSTASTSDLFDGIAWGEWTGQSLLNEVEIHWNDHRMGNGKPCLGGATAGLTPCTSGSRELLFWVWMSKGIWGYTNFNFRVNWAYDGCNLTNLFFVPNVDFNNIRSAVAKIVIQQVRVEPTDEYRPGDCGCTDINRPIPLTEEGATGGSAVIAESGEPCCCTPAAIKIIVSFQMLHFGFISNDASSFNVTFIIAADGYGTFTHDL